jgi:hypothetical protein
LCRIPMSSSLAIPSVQRHGTCRCRGCFSSPKSLFCNFRPIEPIDPTVHLRVSFL